MPRKKHPNKEIEAAIQYAESHGWQYKQAGGSAHAWVGLCARYMSERDV